MIRPVATLTQPILARHSNSQYGLQSQECAPVGRALLALKPILRIAMPGQMLGQAQQFSLRASKSRVLVRRS